MIGDVMWYCTHGPMKLLIDDVWIGPMKLLVNNVRIGPMKLQYRRYLTLVAQQRTVTDITSRASVLCELCQTTEKTNQRKKAEQGRHTRNGLI